MKEKKCNDLISLLTKRGIHSQQRILYFFLLEDESIKKSKQKAPRIDSN